MPAFCADPRPPFFSDPRKKRQGSPFIRCTAMQASCERCCLGNIMMAYIYLYCSRIYIHCVYHLCILPVFFVLFFSPAITCPRKKYTAPYYRFFLQTNTLYKHILVYAIVPQYIYMLFIFLLHIHNKKWTNTRKQNTMYNILTYMY